uniref:Uncharacterized protein n=1 Tax=viral metagenome TaxID=1070528 RepID=A0A6M3L2P3_9ZZZZ
MSRYAQNTSVPVERSRAEIESILQRYGASQFVSGWSMEGEPKATIQFRLGTRVIRFLLPLPDPKSEEFTRTPARRNRRSPAEAQAAWEQACRQRWRALALAIKAKLEAVEAGISEFESEFLAHIVDPKIGRTVGEVIRPQLAASYEALGRDKRQPLLLSFES